MLVVLLLGSNDSARPPSAQHVPITEYRDNLSHIVAHFVSNFPDARYIFITPPQVDSQLWPFLSIARVTEYADVVRQLAAEHNIPLLDLWQSNEFLVTLEDLRVGLHLGLSGNRKVCEGVQDIVRKTYPHLVRGNNEQ